jgi:hypothetical protein
MPSVPKEGAGEIHKKVVEEQTLRQGSSFQREEVLPGVR